VRVALVIFRADPGRGGAERYTADLAAALVRRGHDVSVLASDIEGDPAAAPRRVRLAARGVTRTGRYQAFLDALDAHLAVAAYDVVHAMLPVRRCDAYHPHAGVAAEAVAAGHRKHASAIGRGLARIGNRLNVKRLRFAAVERELLESPRGPVVLCLSEYVKKSVRAHYAMDERRLATLFNGVDLAKFDPSARPTAGREVRERLGVAAGEVVALMIAQDFERKGLAQAIAAVARVGEARLVVVGKDDGAPYARMAESLGVRVRVAFAGATPDPYAYYAAADVFLLPTRHDPCSLVVLEALAMTVPVISTAQNGACEVMTDGREGFVLADPEDIDALAAALRAVLDPAVRERMRTACIDLRPRLSQDAHVDRLVEIYERVQRDRAARAEA